MENTINQLNNDFSDDNSSEKFDEISNNDVLVVAENILQKYIKTFLELAK